MLKTDSKHKLDRLYINYAFGKLYSPRLLGKGLHVVLLVITLMGVSFWAGLTLLDNPDLNQFSELYTAIGRFFNSINQALPHGQFFSSVSPALMVALLLLIGSIGLSFYFFEQMIAERYALTRQGRAAGVVIYLLALLAMAAGLAIHQYGLNTPLAAGQSAGQKKQVVAAKSATKAKSTVPDTQLPMQLLIDSALVLGLFTVAKGIDSVPNKQSKVDYSEFRSQLLSALKELEKCADDCISIKENLDIDRVNSDLDAARDKLIAVSGKEPERYQLFIAQNLEQNILTLKQFLTYCGRGKKELVCELFHEDYMLDLARPGNRAFRTLETLMRKG